MKMFDAPIPGQSLTGTPGGLAMERPPQFTDPNDALEYIFKRLTHPKQVSRLIALLKSETPVEYITRTVLFEGIIQGKWSIDLAASIAQTVMWQIEAIAKLKGINTKFRNEDQDQIKFMSQFTDLLNVKQEAKATEKASKTLFTGLK